MPTPRCVPVTDRARAQRLAGRGDDAGRVEVGMLMIKPSIPASITLVLTWSATEPGRPPPCAWVISAGIWSGSMLSSSSTVISALVSSVAGSRPMSSHRACTTFTLLRQLIEAGNHIEVVEVPCGDRGSSSSRRCHRSSAGCGRGNADRPSPRFGMVPVSGESRPLALDHRQDDLQRLVEPIEPVGEGAELEAELIVFELEPAGADAQNRPALLTTSKVVMILASSVGLR